MDESLLSKISLRPVSQKIKTRYDQQIITQRRAVSHDTRRSGNCSCFNKGHVDRPILKKYATTTAGVHDMSTELKQLREGGGSTIRILPAIYNMILQTGEWPSSCLIELPYEDTGRLRGLAVACWTTDHYHPCSNVGVGISEGYFIFDFALLPFSLPCAQQWL